MTGGSGLRERLRRHNDAIRDHQRAVAEMRQKVTSATHTWRSLDETVHIVMGGDFRIRRLAINPDHWDGLSETVLAADFTDSYNDLRGLVSRRYRDTAFRAVRDRAKEESP